MTTSLYQSVGVVDVIEWACLLCGCCIQMTEQVEQRICIRFCVKLEHSSMDDLDDSEGCSYGQLVIVSLIMVMCPLMHHVSCRDFGETSNHPGESAPVQLRFGTLWLLAIPKTKITFEREEISDHWWGSGNYNGAADSNWENCVRYQGGNFEGNWGLIGLCTMFLVSCIFCN